MPLASIISRVVVSFATQINTSGGSSDTDENALMEVALDAGAEDIANNDDGSLEVITSPHDFVAVKQRLEASGFKPEMAEVTMKPLNEVIFAGDDAVRMQKLLDALEDVDDVQEVYTTAVIEE